MTDIVLASLLLDGKQTRMFGSIIAAGRRLRSSQISIGPTALYSGRGFIRAGDAADEALIEQTEARIRAICARVIQLEAPKLPPTNSPRVMGTWLHKLFADAVKRDALPGVAVESSFASGRDIGYGEAGSLRTDVLLRNEAGKIIAVWDYKTGMGATIPYSRIRALQQAIAGEQGANIPVTVLHTPLITVLKPDGE